MTGSYIIMASAVGKRTLASWANTYLLLYLHRALISASFCGHKVIKGQKTYARVSRRIIKLPFQIARAAQAVLALHTILSFRWQQTRTKFRTPRMAHIQLSSKQKFILQACISFMFVTPSIRWLVCQTIDMPLFNKGMRQQPRLHLSF